MKKLDYEFVCHYDDGSEMKQNFNRRNEKNFGDIDQNRLETFELVGKGKRYGVNVRTGEFNLNGVKVFFEDLENGEDYRLIYFRRVQAHISGFAEKDSEVLSYCFGLQCNVDGRNRQKLIWIGRDGSLLIGNKK